MIYSLKFLDNIMKKLIFIYLKYLLPICFSLSFIGAFVYYGSIFTSLFFALASLLIINCYYLIISDKSSTRYIRMAFVALCIYQAYFISKFYHLNYIVVFGFGATCLLLALGIRYHFRAQFT